MKKIKTETIIFDDGTEVKTEKIKEYDEHGNLIYLKDAKGIELWYDRDEYGRIVHLKDSRGFEEWREYDDQGNIIHVKTSDEYEEWKIYNEHNNVIYYKDSLGHEFISDKIKTGNSIT